MSDDARQRLEEIRDELRERVDALSEPPELGASQGFGKRIGDGTTEAIGRFTDVAVAEGLEAIEAGLERALEKLAEGSYGVCDDCGAEIPAGRLRIRPESVHCVRCAR
jgi:DnaK suppressor protein